MTRAHPKLDLARLGADYRKHVDAIAALRPVPTWHAIGVIVRKPYRYVDLNKLNDLLDQVKAQELALDIYETDRMVSVLAYTPVRRSGRQELPS